MNKVFKYQIPLWPNRYVYFSTDPDALEKRVKRDTGEDTEVCRNYYGETWTIREKDVGIFVNKAAHKTKKAYMITVAHECHHAAYMIMRNMGESKKAEELACRLQDWLLDKIL